MGCIYRCNRNQQIFEQRKLGAALTPALEVVPSRHIPASTPASSDTMPQPAAPMRAVINVLTRAPARQCARLMSTTRDSQHSRRPATQCLPQVQLRQPLVQRRTFKTVEEAKSRYRSGVSITWSGNGVYCWAQANLQLPHSRFPGRPAFSSSSPAAVSCTTSSARRSACRQRG